MTAGRPHRQAGRASRVLAATATALAIAALWPRAAWAADLFPVDDWLGSGIKSAGEVLVGGLKVSAESIAKLLVTIVGALADLLVPKSLVRAGLDGIRWLVALPPVGTAVDQDGSALGVRMPHLHELREVLTWIGITLLPLGLIVSAGRAYLAPGVDGESPSDLFARVLAAAVGLLLYDWAWGVLVRLVKLVTDGLLGLPWVADGIERMLETLLIGGAGGAAVAAEFVIPLMVLFAGGTLLGLVLVHVGLMVATSLVYVLGGLVLGLSVTSFGRRLLAAWLLAATAVVVLPVLWAVVFVTGSALMLDAQPAAGGGGFGGFVAQLFNVAAAAGTFFVAIKLALALFRNATGAITGITSAGPAGGGGGVGARAAAAGGRSSALAANATPAGLARFSGQLRGRAAALMGSGARAAAMPLAHPGRALGTAAHAAAHPIQSTQQAAGTLRAALTRTPTSAPAAPNPKTGAPASTGPAARPAEPTPATGPRLGHAPTPQPPASTKAGTQSRDGHGAGAASAANGRGPNAPSGPSVMRPPHGRRVPDGHATGASAPTGRTDPRAAGRSPSSVQPPAHDSVARTAERVGLAGDDGGGGRARWWALGRRATNNRKPDERSRP